MWVEKYRPTRLENMVLPDEYRKIFERFIMEGEIPHLLLYGPPGSGKTAIARILISNILKDNMDCLIINGSSDTSVNVVRHQIEEFLKAAKFGDSKIKIVFIDEFDHMSPNAFAALRFISQEYHDSGRFIFTCNYLYKIPTPLQSRCQSFEFRKSTREFIKEYCKKILDIEKIEYDEVSIDKVITTYYPDIRKVVNTIQSRCIDGVFNIHGDDIESKEKLFRSFITELLEGILTSNNIIVNNSVKRILDFFKSNEIDYRQIYQDLFYDENVPIWAKIIINQYTNSHINSMIPSMHMMAMIYSIIKAGKQLISMRKK
jgi:DNA polymerase III delta prime subunit